MDTAIKNGKIDVFIFSTSVYDNIPLKSAIHCKKYGIPTICVLDNWMNYTSRLIISEKLFVPDYYFVMDDISFRNTIKQGFPRKNLVVTGHPGLSSLNSTDIKSSEFFGIKQILFAGEPFQRFQLKNNRTIERGYDTENVFPIFCREMQKFSDYIYVRIAPHPSDKSNFLRQLWEKNKGKLNGMVLNPGEGRNVALASDGVAGMASILLYECALVGIPTLSLQPGLINEDLRFFVDKKGIIGICEKNRNLIRNIIDIWANNACSVKKRVLHKDLKMHTGAIQNCLNIIESILNPNTKIQKQKFENI